MFEEDATALVKDILSNLYVRSVNAKRMIGKAESVLHGTVSRYGVCVINKSLEFISN